MNTREMRKTIDELLGTVSEPVAVTFCDTPPSAVERVSSAAPAGCSYWKLAAEGQVFYTIGEDHSNCPIGAYTHGAELAADTQAQLQGMIEKMVGIQYLRMEEVAGIPRRSKPLRYVVYAPLSRADGVPDVVLIRGTAWQMMLLVEAVNARSLMSPLPILGRPACSVIAATAETGKAAASLGCIGNRVYTELPAGEFYVSIPGKEMGQMVDALRSIVAANSELEQYHRSRSACA